jgi:hypothetical protein
MIEKLKNVTKETFFLVVAGLVASFILPWWIIAPLFVMIAFLLNMPDGRAWADGFLAASLIWGMYAYYLDSTNASLLSQKVGTLFSGLKPAHLLWATGIVGGLLGGFAAMTGSALRKLFVKV